MRYLILVALMAGCATVNPYAYTGKLTKQECESICASYGYPLIGLSPDGEGCVCNTAQCTRPKHRGGCEKLPGVPQAATQK